MFLFCFDWKPLSSLIQADIIHICNGLNNSLISPQIKTWTRKLLAKSVPSGMFENLHTIHVDTFFMLIYCLLNKDWTKRGFPSAKVMALCCCAAV
jgi:hypothetical protein